MVKLKRVSIDLTRRMSVQLPVPAGCVVKSVDVAYGSEGKSVSLTYQQIRPDTTVKQDDTDTKADIKLVKPKSPTTRKIMDEFGIQREQTYCNGEWYSLEDDRYNCGMAGGCCPPGYICRSGQCINYRINVTGQAQILDAQYEWCTYKDNCPVESHCRLHVCPPGVVQGLLPGCCSHGLCATSRECKI